MTYCREHTAVKFENANRIAVSLRCRAWTCEDCVEMRKKQLICQGFAGAPNLFITLTHRYSKLFTPGEAARRLSWAWRLCRLRLMRKHKLKHLPFLAVIEKHKSGWPHIHILARARYIPFAEISAIMKELIDSPRVRIEAIRNRSKMHGYCVKYCSKATEKFETAKRYWQSRDYDIRDPSELDIHPKEPGNWMIEAQSVWNLAQLWENLGGKVEFISAYKAILLKIDVFR